MPKNESDPEDPMELHGVAFLTEEDTSETMTECFVEEFLRLGHSADEVLSLFRNPHYTGPNMVYQNRGEDFVKTKISEVFGWWRCPAVFGSGEDSGSSGRSPLRPVQASPQPATEPATGSEHSQSLKQP